jgi:hypothetical protein
LPHPPKRRRHSLLPRSVRRARRPTNRPVAQCCNGLPMICPLSVCHRRAVPSSRPVKISRPSGLHCAARTPSGCCIGQFVIEEPPQVLGQLGSRRVTLLSILSPDSGDSIPGIGGHHTEFVTAVHAIDDLRSRPDWRVLSPLVCATTSPGMETAGSRRSFVTKITKATWNRWRSGAALTRSKSSPVALFPIVSS